MSTSGAISPRTILIVNGPNLNMLGTREPSVYGSDTLEDHLARATAAAAHHGATVDSFQSNAEGEIVNAVQQATGKYDAIVINPGAFTHYSWALHDALRSFTGPIIEVHLSNPSARESFRHTSVIASLATGTISGFGGRGYVLAVDALFT
jgi:3-dehydroquinate dehydratase-2